MPNGKNDCLCASAGIFKKTVEIELRSIVLLLERYKSSFSSQLVNTFYVFALCARGKMINDSRTTVYCKWRAGENPK